MIEGIISNIGSYLQTILVGVVIILFGFGFGVLAKKLVYRILKEIELNKIMSKVGVSHDLEKTISVIITYVIYLVTIIVALRQIGIIPIYLVYLIVGAIFMLILLTSLVGLKDVIPNFIAWILLQRKGRVREGHRVDVREISGRVEKIGFLETEIKTDSGDILYVPNSLFLKSKFWVRK